MFNVYDLILIPWANALNLLKNYILYVTQSEKMIPKWSDRIITVKYNKWVSMAVAPSY